MMARDLEGVRGAVESLRRTLGIPDEPVAPATDEEWRGVLDRLNRSLDALDERLGPPDAAPPGP